MVLISGIIVQMALSRKLTYITVSILQGAIDSVGGLREYLSLPVCSKEEKKSSLGGLYEGEEAWAY